jgi:polyferredoxin
VILYATAMTVVGVVMLTALLLRPDLDVNVLHDRNPIYVKLSDGGLRNGYTIKLLNKLYGPRSFSIGVTGLPGASLSVIGHDRESHPVVTVPPDQLGSLRLYVTLDQRAVGALPESATEFSFVVTDLADQSAVEHRATFQGPSR